MLLYIIRHADPDYARDTITDHGHREAAALGRRMAALAPTALYTSTLPRAIHTAEYTARETGLRLQEEAWTREISGLSVTQEQPYGTTSLWDLHAEHIHRSGPFATTEQWLSAPPFSPAPEASSEDPAEISTHIRANSNEFLARHGFEADGVGYRITGDRAQRIAVFCHGGFGLTWFAHLLSIPVPLCWASFYMWPSSVTTILFDERTEGYAVPRCVGFADRSHLYAEGIHSNPRGIKANAE